MQRYPYSVKRRGTILGISGDECYISLISCITSHEDECDFCHRLNVCQLYLTIFLLVRTYRTDMLLWYNIFIIAWRNKLWKQSTQQNLWPKETLHNELDYFVIATILLCIKLQEANVYINYLKVCVHAKILKLCMHVSILLNRLYKIAQPNLLL
jgi:hypothetical protein